MSEFKFEEVQANIADDDLIILEALIKSPAFAALRRTIASYQKGCQSILLSAMEANTMFRAQGLILGLNVVESLPGLLVSQGRKKREAQEKLDEEKKKIEQRTKRT